MDIEKYSKIFKALGDSNRLQIFGMFQEGPKCANDILDKINISQSTLSHHLKQLMDAELVLADRKKKTIYYSVNSEVLESCRDVLKPLMEETSESEQSLDGATIDGAVSAAFRKTAKYMWLIDLENDSYCNIEYGDGRLLAGEYKPNANRNLNNTITFILDGELQKQGQEFVDLTTLSERMNSKWGQGVLGFSFESPSVGWVRAAFIAVAYDEDGNLKKVIYVLRNIAEEKKEEKACKEQLFRLEQLKKEEDAMRRDFLSRLSSSFRNPLSEITGTVDVIRKVAEDSDKVLSCADTIERSSLSLLTLIKDVSEVSEIESGKLLFVEEPTNVWDLIRDVSNVIEPVADRMGVEFVRKRSGRFEHPNIVCSGPHVRYLLRILLGNSIRSCAEGDKVVFDMKEQDMFGDKASYLVNIKDNGKGERNESGYAICKQIVDKIGGALNMKSLPGGGIELAMMLPLTVDRRMGAQDEKNKFSLKGKKILVVEDNEINLEISQFLLEDIGAKVATARDGKRAVELFKKSKENEFDLILMDIMMPKMDGLTATKEIRKLKRKDSKSVPIIAMSANAMSEDEQKSLKAGMDARVGKPLGIQKLLSVIQSFVGQ